MPSLESPTPLTSFDQIRSQWQALLERSAVNNLYVTPVWQELWWGDFQDGRSLAGFYLTDADGEVSAIASLSRAESQFSLVGNSDTFDYNDFIVAAGEEAVFYPTLLDTISANGAQRLDLFSISEDSPTLELLPALARDRGFSVEVAEEDVAPRAHARRDLGRLPDAVEQEGSPRTPPQAPAAGFPGQLALVLRNGSG